jgi:hypothetical protein
MSFVILVIIRVMLCMLFYYTITTSYRFRVAGLWLWLLADQTCALTALDLLLLRTGTVVSSKSQWAPSLPVIVLVAFLHPFAAFTTVTAFVSSNRERHVAVVIFSHLRPWMMCLERARLITFAMCLDTLKFISLEKAKIAYSLERREYWLVLV